MITSSCLIKVYLHAYAAEVIYIYKEHTFLIVQLRPVTEQSKHVCTWHFHGCFKAGTNTVSCAEHSLGPDFHTLRLHTSLVRVTAVARGGGRESIAVLLPDAYVKFI